MQSQEPAQRQPSHNQDMFLELVRHIETSQIASEAMSVLALQMVRNGIITGEGPTTEGRVHFSRSLDTQDANWCERIVIAAGGETGLPVSRMEAEALFHINEAAADRDDEGRFDALLAKAVIHHAASASGLPVPPRAIALAPETDIESWAPTRAVGVDTEVLEWIAGQMRSKRRSNRALMSVAAILIGATTMPVAQSLAQIADFGV